MRVWSLLACSVAALALLKSVEVWVALSPFSSSSQLHPIFLPAFLPLLVLFSPVYFHSSLFAVITSFERTPWSFGHDAIMERILNWASSSILPLSPTRQKL
jgi:hypothetical protein